MQPPLISVIIPCYQQAHWLPEAIASLQAQTYVHWEAIIVNDASPDNTHAVAGGLAQQDARIRLIDLPENGGVSRARNAGIADAKGKYLLPLDADDTINPTYLQKAVEILETDPTIKLVYGLARFAGGQEGVFELPPYSFRQHLVGNCIHNSALVRTKDIVEIGGYDEKMEAGIEDWELWVHLLQPADKVFCIPEPVLNYRQLPDSRSMQLNADRAALQRTMLYLYQKHAAKYLSEFGAPQMALRRVKQLEKEKAHWKQSFRYRFGRMFTAKKDQRKK